MNDFLVFLLYFAAGYVSVRLIMHLIRRYLEHKLQQMQAELEEIHRDNVPCRVERYGDIFYIYDARNGDFVAQGTTVAEIREHVEKTRYRDRRIFVTEGDDDVVEALKGTQTNLETGHA